MVLELLDALDAGPRRSRELAMWCTGRFFGLLCFVGGFFGPMYAAGRLEAMNVGQYERARALAVQLDLGAWVACLEEMRAEEDRHERFFGDQVRGHWLLRPTSAVLGWTPPAALAPEVFDAA